MIDPARKPPENRIHLFDPVGLITDSYASHVIRPARRATRSHDGGGSPLRFAVETKSPDGGESDSSSPRLWNAAPASPKPPQSPDSRTQAIARGRKELMEMIKDMPESSYELSLRDIVDRKSASPNSDSNSNPNPSEKQRKKAIKKKKKIARCRSVDNGGFLLKTSVFPVSFWVKTKNKKKKLGTKTNATAKPSKSSESSNSGSASSSRSSSISSGQAQSSRFLPSCFSFKAKKQT